ncbi:N,N-dimethylformamidase beta subunit family domain-containing protein [Streptomyces sp. NRRL S-87]|uniref:N,N-dimethylformamidase beta subunit family domain-containing protein n=1 Tax=Streptomyces sp. NRRL S-87 TaxID=1463920 RepID=UPI00068A5981|nr:N,N-dimethylformamidase beta subunit family domain-containing protein [Streptomyces sp. NRRL S-87]
MAQAEGPDRDGSGSTGSGRRRVLGLAAASLAAAHPLVAAAQTAEGAALPPSRGLDVRAENARPGHPDWRVTRTGAQHDVEGFADRTSVRPGEPFTLRVSTTAAAYTVSAYRMGWYGGARARLVWRSEPLPGTRQAPARTDPATRMVRTDWEPSARIDTTGWPEGCYLLRLDTRDGRAQRYVPITLRSRSTAGRTVLVNAVATWQAYNRWGGAELYQGSTGRNDSRSLAVSFDRPYVNRKGGGQFMFFEAPLLALAERLGLPLAYATGVDVAREARLLRGAAAVLSPGHDEYWSPEQRLHVTRARDRGTNLAVFGANCCYRRVRFEPSPLGPDRIVVCYKEDYARDPGYRRGLPPTHDFRDGPAADPESALLGVLYDGYPVDAPYVVSRPGHWLFTGTGVRAGESFAHLVGIEYDRVDTTRPTPRPIEILAHSPVVCKGRRSHADSAYLTLPGGAAVFATGTMRWVEALDAQGPGDGANHGMDGRTGRFTRTVTENVLRAFARGPVGRVRPAADNVTAHYPNGPHPGA